MNAAPGLESLLAALRQAGFTVGAGEILRLRQVFALEPMEAGDGARWMKALLRAVLLKDSAQTEHFERLVDNWWQSLPPPPAPPKKPNTSPPGPRPVISGPQDPPARRATWARLSSLLALALLLLVLPPQWRNVSDSPPAEPPAEKPAPAPVLEPAPTIRLVPQIRFTSPQARWQGHPEAALGLAALLAVTGLYLVLRRRRWLPEAAPLPSRAGPPRLWLKHPATGPVLLEREEQQGLVWGLDRYLAETPTRQLDIKATVKVTAKTGGIPQIQFQRARHARALWLWLDESADDTHLRRLAAELSGLLSAHGLPLEIAGFWGAPFSLRGERGERFAPREIEERRDTAWVAILTDGRDLARQNRQDDQRARLDGLLRGLSHWPRLWFVDASAGASGLPAILKRHGLECLPVEELARRIATGKSRQRRRPDPDGHLWEAACALSPSPVETSLAWHIRGELKLRASPWTLRQWREAGPGGRLFWPAPARPRLLNGLRAAEISLAGSSLFDRALNFWLEVYQKEAGRCAEDSPAWQHWRMENALLRLWREPAKAIPELYRLFQGPLEPAIRQQLAQYAPGDWGMAASHIILPWAWHQRSGLERKMLQAMGFGGGLELGAVKLRSPARQWLGLALLLGLGLGAGLAAWRKPSPLPTGAPQVIHGPGRPPQFQQELVPLADGQWRLSIATEQDRAEQTLPAAALARVEWAAQTGDGNAALPREFKDCPDCPAMVELPPGKFLMGSPETEKERYEDEGPRHEVQIGHRLALGKYEVSFAEWDACEAAKACPHANDEGWGRGLRPVIYVSWDDVQAYIRWLNGKTGLDYRLPSEAEWEYAARVGTTTPFSTGTCITTAQANYNGTSDYNACGAKTGVYPQKTQPVGHYPANPWGLHEVHGNVWEWVGDCWHESYEGAPGDGSAWDGGTECASGWRVLRGGSWVDYPRFLRSAYRYWLGAGNRYDFVGFRLARTLTP